MAIVSMKRFHMLAMKEDKEKLLKALQGLGCVEISSVNDASEQKAEYTDSNVERLKWAINYLSKYSNVKKPLFPQDEYVSSAEANAVLQKKDSILAVVERVENIEREQGKLSSEIMKLNASIAELNPWIKLDIAPSKMQELESVNFVAGNIPTQSLSTLNADENFAKLLSHNELISEVGSLSYVAFVIYKKDYQEAIKILKDNGFNQVNISYEDSIENIIKKENSSIDKLNKQQELLKEELTQKAVHIKEMEKLYDLLSIDEQRLSQYSKLYNTSQSFYLKGWIPEKDEAIVRDKLLQVSKHIEIEVTEPEEGEEAPVLLNNNKVVKPFESIVKGFSYPSVNGIDPTSVMMPFFANFFGMMLSDAGYGLLMVIAIPIIIKFFNPKFSMKQMMKMFLWGGATTVIWGALYNTWFGFGPFNSVFDPINKPMPVMMLCVAAGAVHLLAGLCVSIYMSIKRKDYNAAIFDQFSWALLLIGLGLLIVPSVSNIGKVMAIIGALMIVLMAGREKKNIFSRLMSGFGALYGVMGWISDLLSYMRLFGMGLATGVIGMVINILVGMIFQGGIIAKIIAVVLFVGAHLFNFGINALGAYVHSCRLQYIEFFGKFFEDGGRPFVPLDEKTRYIQISKEN